MMRNRASLDKWLMAVALGALMIVAGLSSTDKGWAVIGAAILVVALLIGALEIYSWTRKSQGKSAELPTPVVVVLCMIAVPVLGVWGFKTGDIEAVLIAVVLVILLVLLFLLRNTGPIKIGEFSMNIPVSSKSVGGDSELAEAMKEAAETGQPIKVAEFKANIPINDFLRAMTDATADAPGNQVKTDFKTNIPLIGGNGDFIRGIAQAMTGDTEKAIGSFRRYGIQRGDIARTEPAQTVALLSSHRYEEALLEADRALAVGLSGTLRMLRGQALLALGATEEALAEFQSAKSNGGAAGVETSIGAALLELGRTGEGIAALESDRAGSAATSATFFYLGEAYRQTGRDEEAPDQYEEAAAKAIVESQYGLAWHRGVLPLSLIRLGRVDAADGAAKDAFASAPTDSTVRIARALIAVKRGATDSALTDLGEALAVNPHAVVRALEDPDFAPLVADEPGRQLLQKSKAAREGVLERVRSKAATV